LCLQLGSVDYLDERDLRQAQCESKTRYQEAGVSRRIEFSEEVAWPEAFARFLNFENHSYSGNVVQNRVRARVPHVPPILRIAEQGQACRPTARVIPEETVLFGIYSR